MTAWFTRVGETFPRPLCEAFPGELMVAVPRIKDVFVYLSGPISPAHGFTIGQNVASAVVVYLQCCRLGLPAFCPHLSAIFEAAEVVEYPMWMAIDLAVLDRCTHLLQLPRWETSPGAQIEVAFARSKGLPIVSSPEEIAC